MLLCTTALNLVCVMQVFFVCSDGAVFGLCPVAPFHAPVSLAAVQHLLTSSQHHQQGMGHATTSAWLSQVINFMIGPLLSSLSEVRFVCCAAYLSCTVSALCRCFVDSAWYPLPESVGAQLLSLGSTLCWSVDNS